MAVEGGGGVVKNASASAVSVPVNFLETWITRFKEKERREPGFFMK
jgi:hypothetical protein